jgi:hypothetical protein
MIVSLSEAALRLDIKKVRHFCISQAEVPRRVCSVVCGKTEDSGHKATQNLVPSVSKFFLRCARDFVRSKREVEP